MFAKYKKQDRLIFMPVIKFSWNDPDGENEKFFSPETIKGILYFLNPLPILSECLNTNILITINGVNGTMSTPQLPSNFPKNKDTFLTPPRAYNLRFDDISWGRILVRPRGDSLLGAVFLSFQKGEKDISGYDISTHVKEWQQRFLDNLTIISGHYVRNSLEEDSKSANAERKFELFSNEKQIIY